jgi:hypothetical protein
MNPETHYQTSDLYLASYLIMKGAKFKVEKGSKKSQFVFDRTPDLSAYVDEYLTGTGSCEPLAYTNAIKNLKNLLFNR